jgi:L-asparaginase II
MTVAYTTPWAPLYTLERDGIADITVYGTACVWAGQMGPLFSIGNTHAHLWGRSLLKPFQLLTLLPSLQQHYPELEPDVFALMMGSHNGDTQHTQIINSVLKAHHLSEADLICPVCSPLSSTSPNPPSKLTHPCSGKHLAHLLWCLAEDVDKADYASESFPPFRLLKTLLGWYLGKEVDSFQTTTDGCGLPTLALSASELSQLYCALTQPLPLDEMMSPPEEIEPLIPLWGYLRTLIQDYPLMIGGADRLDSQLVIGQDLNHNPLPKLPSGLIAKEGADGLLAVGLMPSQPYKDGLGILIKLAHAYDPKATEHVLKALFNALGFQQVDKASDDPNQVLVSHFNFQPLIGAGLLGEKSFKDLD